MERGSPSRRHNIPKAPTHTWWARCAARWGRSVLRMSPCRGRWPQITSWGRAKIVRGKFIDCGSDRAGAPTRTGIGVRERDGAWTVNTTVGRAVRLGMGMVQRLSLGGGRRVLERWTPGNERILARQ